MAKKILLNHYEKTNRIPAASIAKELHQTLEPNINSTGVSSTQFNLLLRRINQLERNLDSMSDQIVKLNIQVYDLENPIERDLSIGY